MEDIVMKKNKKVLLFCSIVLAMILMTGTIVLAGDTAPNEIFYCDMCGQYLSSGYTHVAHYSTSHEVLTDFTDMYGHQLTAHCDITHDITQKGKYCSVHGLKWIGSRHIAEHSFPDCTDEDYWE